MRKKWLYLVEVLGFLLLFCLLFGTVQNIMSHKLRTENPVKNFFKEKEDSLDVLILGSSHAYYSFFPMVMWEKQGIAAYNLGSPIQSMGASYYLLRQALKEQNPEVVVLETYCTYLESASKTDERLRSVSDNLPMGIEKSNLIREMDLTDPVYSYYFPFFKYHDRWKELQKNDFQAENSYCKGAVVQTGTKPKNVPESIKETRGIPELSKKYLDKIIALCRKEQINLVLAETPFTQDDPKEYLRKRGILNAVEQYAEEENIPFLNYFTLADEIDLDYQTDMLESQHLNMDGAVKATDYLASFLAEKYELPDRRGTEGYEQWQQDSEDFNQYMRSKKLPAIKDTAEYLESLKEGNYTIVLLENRNDGTEPDQTLQEGLQSLGFMKDSESVSTGSYLGVLRKGSVLYETYEQNREYQFYEGLDYISAGNAERAHLNVNKNTYKIHKESTMLLVYDPISKKVVDNRRILKDGTLK